ncbi:MAG TPA: 50S ribosomal protein L1 [Candidatus Azoamicus sp. OHIO1]
MLKKITKKKLSLKNIINKNELYSFTKGIEILKKINPAKFNETVEISINLKLNPKKRDYSIKGFSLLPYNSGKILKVAVFASENEIDAAKNADLIISKEKINEIKDNKINFDILITTPNSITKMGNLSKTLGPKGLMPNIKFGTITNNISDTINSIKTNYIKFKSEKNNIIHCIIGKINNNTKELKENIETIINDIKKNKPSNCKSMTIEKLFVSTTMGPGIKINLNSINIK